MQLVLRVPSAAAGVIGMASVATRPAREIHVLSIVVLTIAALLTIQALHRRAKTKRYRRPLSASGVVSREVARPMPAESVPSWYVSWTLRRRMVNGVIRAGPGCRASSRLRSANRENGEAARRR